jgi:hypothetical protein
LNNIPKKKKKQQFQRVRKKKFQSERKKAFKTDNAGAELLVVDGGYSKKKLPHLRFTQSQPSPTYNRVTAVSFNPASTTSSAALVALVTPLPPIF